MGFFRRTPELFEQQRNSLGRRPSTRSLGDWIGLILGAAWLVTIVGAVVWTLAFDRPSPLDSATLILLAAALILMSLGRIRRYVRGTARSRRTQPTATEMGDTWHEMTSRPDSPFPKELLDAGLSREVFELMERTGGIPEGGRSYTWTAMKRGDGQIETHFHEDTVGGERREASYSGSGSGLVWKIVKSVVWPRS